MVRLVKDFVFMSTYLAAEKLRLKKLADKAWSAFLANGPVYTPRCYPADDVQ